MPVFSHVPTSNHSSSYLHFRSVFFSDLYGFYVTKEYYIVKYGNACKILKMILKCEQTGWRHCSSRAIVIVTVPNLIMECLHTLSVIRSSRGHRVH